MYVALAASLSTTLLKSLEDHAKYCQRERQLSVGVALSECETLEVICWRRYVTQTERGGTNGEVLTS